jgi:hypothetical protein
MFAHHCTACDVRHLIFPSQIISLANSGDGFAVTYECWCGAEQVYLTSTSSEQLAEVAA